MPSIHDLQNEQADRDKKAHRVTAVDAGGNSVSFAIEDNQDILSRYNLANFDTGSPIYVGKVDKDGNWFIKKIDTTTGEAFYTKGESNYSNKWSDRHILTYDTFDNIF